MNRGGKRAGAGRKPGPEKIRISARVLPETARNIAKQALTKTSLGEFFDEVFKKNRKIT